MMIMGSKTKFTPGPWVANQLAIMGATSRLAVIDGKHTEENQANAYLVAAAPRLYEELSDLAEFMESAGYDVTEAQAALAIARGEEPPPPTEVATLAEFAQLFVDYEFGKAEDETDSEWHDRLSDTIAKMRRQAETALTAVRT